LKLQEGCYVPKKENYSLWVSDLQKLRCMGKIIPLLEKESRWLEKTGEYNLEAFNKIREHLCEFDGLTRSAARKSPISIQIFDINPEPVKWLWPNYLPSSKLSLISGDPGGGKTWLCLDIAARYSTGRAWPDGASNEIKGNTLILSCEDGAADTYRPRLDILKADLSRIFLIQEPLDLSTMPGRIRLAAEIDRRRPDLIIIDPIFDFSGNVNPNAVEKVRAMLTPLVSLAERSRATLILTSHLNKSSTMQALYRNSGSASGWVGKARAAFLVIKDVQGQEEYGQQRRIFAPIKANLSRTEPQALFFRITDNPGLTFEPVPEGFNLEEQLSSNRIEAAPLLDKAKAFLSAALKEGPVESNTLFQQAQEAGIRERTLIRAKRALKISSMRDGGTYGRWLWGQ
jgi:hypothetical protein